MLNRFCQLVLFVLAMSASTGMAAVLNVTSSAADNPAATSCPFATPCSMKDALRIAEANGEDDAVRLQEPSTFMGGQGFHYHAAASDRDRDLLIEWVAGSGLFDAGQSGLRFDLRTDGSGYFEINGLTLVNSRADFHVDPVLTVRSLGDIRLRNCTIGENRRVAAQYPDTAAAAAQLEGRLVRIDNCGFLNNRPGAVRIVADRAEVRGSSFSQNGEPNLRGGAALRILAYSALVEDNSFLGNRASDVSTAGALVVSLTRTGIPQLSADSSISRNLFDDNSSGYEGSGGAMSLSRSVGTLATVAVDRNVFRRNVSNAGSGGAAFLAGSDNTRLLVRSNLFHHNSNTLFNSRFGYGSALRVFTGAELHLLNNTVVRNSAQVCNSGAVHITAESFQTLLQVHNNIATENHVTVCSGLDEDLRIDGDVFASAILRNNKISEASLFPGQQAPNVTVVGALFVLPTFVDPDAEDFHLAPLSQLVNAGSTASSYLPSADIDGQSRIQDSAIDVGADEFAGTQSRLVSVSKLGNGTGSIGSIPSGLLCDTGCAQAFGSFDLNSTIGLVALPGPGSVFRGWGGDCTGSATGTTVLVSDNRSCTARFEPQTFNVVVRARGLGSGDVAADVSGFPSLIYPLNDIAVLEDIIPGSSVTFTAQNFNGFYATYWPDCETQGGSVAGQYGSPSSCTFSNLLGNKDITVELRNSSVLFPTRTLSVTKTGAGNGRMLSVPAGIDCTSNCSSTFFVDTQVELHALADSSSYLAGWGGDCAGPVGQNPFVQLTMSADLNCTVRFEPAARLAIGIAGNGGGALLDNTTPYSLSYQAGSGPFSYDPLFPLNAPVEIQAIADPGNLAFFLDCDQAALGMSVSGNGTAHATCNIGHMSQHGFLNLLIVKEQHQLSVQAFGNGSGGVSELGGALALSYPASNLAQSAPIDYGTELTVEAVATAGDTAHWTGCSGAGTVLSGQGTAIARCRLGLYQTTQLGVEFRHGGPGDAIFSNGFD